ncbi:MAG: HypC/HybG/HupF family hydrogenase formation chaperone [Candidatus Zixiibacteriota bacterium]
MCLGIPVKVVEKEGSTGVAELKGVRRTISLELLEEVNVGDWVILHAGFAIQKVDQEEAEKTLKLFEELDSIEGK